MMMSTNELATIPDDRLDDVSGGAGPMPDQPEGMMSVGHYADPHNGGNACVPSLGQAAGHGIISAVTTGLSSLVKGLGTKASVGAALISAAKGIGKSFVGQAAGIGCKGK